MEFSSDDMQMIATIAMNEKIESEIEIISTFEIEVVGGEKNFTTAEGTSLKEVFNQIGLELPNLEISPSKSLNDMTDYEIYHLLKVIIFKTGKVIEIPKSDFSNTSFDFDYIQLTLK